MPKKPITAPIHPKILLEEFMRPAGISINGLALSLRVPATRISAIGTRREASPRHRPSTGSLLFNHQ